MRPLEVKIRQSFIPIITGQSAPDDTMRTLLSLPVRLGGLSLTDPMTVADTEYEASVRLTAPLADLIVLHEKTLGESCHQQRLIKKEISYEKRKQAEQAAEKTLAQLPVNQRRKVALAQEKGASSWLTVRPLREHGFDLSKSAFHDAICLRYGWPLHHLRDVCVCGQAFTADHAMSCPTGGFPSIRHNEVRDILGTLVSEVSSATEIEPVRQTLTG